MPMVISCNLTKTGYIITLDGEPYPFKVDGKPTGHTRWWEESPVGTNRRHAWTVGTPDAALNTTATFQSPETPETRSPAEIASSFLSNISQELDKARAQLVEAEKLAASGDIDLCRREAASIKALLTRAANLAKAVAEGS